MNLLLYLLLYFVSFSTFAMNEEELLQKIVELESIQNNVNYNTFNLSFFSIKDYDIPLNLAKGLINSKQYHFLPKKNQRKILTDAILNNASLDDISILLNAGSNGSVTNKIIDAAERAARQDIVKLLLESGKTKESDTIKDNQ